MLLLPCLPPAARWCWSRTVELGSRFAATILCCVGYGRPRAQLCEHARWRKRQLRVPNAGGVIERVGYRCRGRNDRDLVDFSDAQRMGRIGNLDDMGFNQRQVKVGRHPVIEESRIS